MKSPQQQQKAAVSAARESVVGSNTCTMCLYNIPRGSLMITVPGLIIAVCGAAMTGFVDTSQSWTDGRAMIALVCLALGGAWTLGGLVYWFIAWCRLKPRRPRRRKIVVSAGHDNEGVQLEGVISRPCYTPPPQPHRPRPAGTDQTQDDVKTTTSNQQQADDVQKSSVPDDDDVIYTLP